MSQLIRLKDKAMELGVNAVGPAYSKIAAKVNELGDTPVGRVVEGAASSGIAVVAPAVERVARVIPGAGPIERLVRDYAAEAPAPRRPTRKPASKPKPARAGTRGPALGKLVSGSEPQRPEDLPIVGYDSLLAEEILVRLKGLTQSELAQVYKYERAHDNRTTILEAVEARLIDLPLPTYDSLKVPAILDAVNGLTRRELYTIHEYEQGTRNRLPIIEKIDALLGT
ncbi:MAG: hypothetical protein ACRDLB_03270 [Actinomycetota bacterium]